MSVVIPAWNAAGTIGRALDSALAGMGPDVECVVADDASTDGTADLVAGLAARDPRIVLVRAEVNAGASVARNLALDVARGEWLTFLDSDDVLLPGGLAALLRAADGGVLAVIGQREWTDGATRWITRSYDHSDIRTPGRASLVTRPGLMAYASATGKLFHRSLVDGLRFEGRVLGDQPWTIRALLRAGEQIVVIDDVVYEWRRDAAAGSSSITAAKRGSARLAAEAARVAVRAFADVAAEAAVQLPDGAARDRVVAAYLDRLVRSDFAGPVRRATRGDEGAAALFDAIEAFLASVPAAMVAASPAVPPALLRPPLDRWLWLSRDARTAFVRLLRTVAARSGEAPAGWWGPGPLRLATELLLRSDAAASRGAATALLVLRLPAVALGRARHGRADGRRVLRSRES